MTVAYDQYHGEPYTVLILPLPSAVPALINFDESGYPTIMVNANLSREEQSRALRHELRHWDRSDAYNTNTIKAIETQPT